MAKNSIRDYSATSSLNTDVQSVDISEGCAASGINNAIREVMADLKDVSSGTVALETPSADQLNVDNIRIDGNTISSTDTNGNITLDPDGTGNTVVSSGNVGIGTASPNSHLTTQTSSTSTSAFDFGVQVNNSYASNDSIAAIGFHNRADVNGTGVGGAIAYVGGGASGGSGNITFNIKDNTDISNVVDVADEKMRIDSSGRLAVNTASPNTSYKTTIQADSTTGALSIDGPSTNGYWAAEWDMPSGSTYGILFKNGGSNVGNIRINASSTSYNTSSDHRLKENVADMTGAIDRVKALAPKRFNFIADADTTVDGFLAHEAQAVVPEAVTGTKDAMRDEEYEVTPAVLDDDGNVVTEAVMGTRSVPDYQGIDQSKLVPLLTGALQEAIAKIEALETRIEALENA